MKALRYVMWICATLLIVFGVTAMWMTMQMHRPPADMRAVNSVDLKDNRLYAMEELVLTDVYSETGDTLYIAAYTQTAKNTPLVLSVRVSADSSLAQEYREKPDGESMTVSGYVFSDGQMASKLVDAGYATTAAALSKELSTDDVAVHFAIKDFLYVCDLQGDYASFVRTTTGLYVLLGAIMLVCAAALIIITVVQIKREHAAGGMSASNPLRKKR